MKVFKGPDKKAPRYRQSSLSILNEDLYNKYKLKNPHSKIDNEKFKAIIGSFNQKLREAVVENRDGVELPEGLGYVFLGSCKSPKKENLDYKKSTELGQFVLKRNLNSDGYLAKIFYTNYASKYNFANKKLWAFKGAREFTNAVSKAYAENWPKYIVVEDYQLVSSLFRQSTKSFIVKKGTPIPDNYNEFDLD
jgi:hypothetical protein